MIDPYHIIRQYYPEGTSVYNILVTHSECVRDKALEIIEHHPELNVDRQFVTEAAMLHDIGIYQTNAPSIGCLGTHLYIEHGYLGADLLRSLGLERHALVAERHTGTGLDRDYIARMHYPLPDRDFMPQTIEEKLVCYADKFYSKSRDLRQARDIDTVRRKLAKWGEQSVARFDTLHTLFG